jgi:hypothetical protein
LPDFFRASILPPGDHLSQPPHKGRHLQVFGISLLVILGILVTLLFLVHLEATIPATGIVQCEELCEIRAEKAGRIELGFSNSTKNLSSKSKYWIVGDKLKASDKLATLRPEGTADPVTLLVPDLFDHWSILELPAQNGQNVTLGTRLALLAPIDPESGQTLCLTVRLKFEERDFAEVSPGQEVRLYSPMYHHRVHGIAKGRITRIEPQGEPGEGNSRVFHAWAEVIESPFKLKVGGSVKADVVIGKKRTAQIILEH